MRYARTSKYICLVENMLQYAMLSFLYDKMGLNNVSHQRLMEWATKIAVIASLIILALRSFAYQQTCSHTLYNMILDSIFDIGISLINFFIIKFVAKRTTIGMRYSYDKIAALASLAQGVILMGLVISNMLGIGHNHAMGDTTVAIVAMLISTVLCVFTVSFQVYVIKITHSVIIEADMVHYKTDLLADAVAILSMILTRYTNTAQIDRVIGIAIGIYLMMNASRLIYKSAGFLLDHQNQEKLPLAQQLLVDRKLTYSNLFVTYSGMRHVVTFDIIISPASTMTEIYKLIGQLEHEVSHLFPGENLFVKITPVLTLKVDIDLVNPDHVKCCHAHAH